MERFTFADLKDAVMRQIAAVPVRPETLLAILDRPKWQVDAAVRSLSREGLVQYQRGYLRAVRVSGKQSTPFTTR